MQLTPKAAAVLACLHRHKGEVVATETFLNEIWPEVHVTPDLVREYIHDLRTALDDDAKRPRFIETVRGKGFRLIGDVEEAPEEGIVAARTEVEEHQPTVAVLKPVVAGAPELSSLSEAVASDIINRLARFHYVGVVARRSSFSFDEVTDLRAFARDIHADYVLESHFARFEQITQVRLQLVDTETGKNVWGERIDLDVQDPIAIVDEITSTVVMALTGWHGELHRAEFKSIARRHTGKLNAFEHFVMGCDLEMRLDADNLKRSLSHLQKSVELNPTFARAWLVYALELRWAYAVIPGRDRTYLDRAQEAFQTAFNLAPTDPVNLALMAMNTARIGNLADALNMLKRAEAGMAGDSDAMVCVATAISVLTDDVERACRIFDEVKSANQAPPSWFYFAEAVTAFMAGQYTRCVSASLSGPQEISAMVFRCLAFAMLDDDAKAVHAHSELRQKFPHVDFVRFARNFPIVSPPRLHSYEVAVDRLHTFMTSRGGTF
ncbi:MAG: winged helix-turn-helix domain-containing protein [Pseudomonadota bacterium]